MPIPRTINQTFPGTVHASCIALSSLMLTSAIEPAGVLLRGPSGSGKSDLTLRALEAGAELVTDDRVVLTAESGQLYASPPETLAGLLEVRGLGVFRLAAHLKRAPIRLVADLTASERISRMPDWAPCPHLRRSHGIDIARIDLAPFEASALAKLQMALARALGRVEAIQ